MDDRSGTGPGPGTGSTLMHPHLALVPVQAGDPSPRDDEARLTRLALAARAGDCRARDALYQALTPNINRMVAGSARLTWAADCPRRDGQPWDREDLRQEAYLIFHDLIRAWPGEGPFTPYLFAYFPWRLRNAWRKLRPDRPRGATLLRRGPELAADASAVAEEARVILETMSSRLPEVERIILIAYVRDGVTLAEIGRRLGLRPRQVRRRWVGIKRWLRGEVEIPAAGGKCIPFPNRPPARE